MRPHAVTYGYVIHAVTERYRPSPQAEEKAELNRRRKKLRLAEEKRWREKEAQMAHKVRRISCSV